MKVRLSGCRGQSSGARNKFLVVLVLAFEFEKPVVTTFLAIRKFAANRGSPLVDSAASGFRVKEHARCFIDVVFTVFQNTFVDILVRIIRLKFVLTRITKACGIFRNAEMIGQTGDIFVRDNDPRISAAVPRALTTVVVYF